MMRLRHVAECTLLIVLLQSVPLPARADDLRPEPDPVLRLDGWLRRNEERTSRQRIIGGVFSIVAGVLTIGLGVWANTADESDGLDLAGLALIGLAPITLATGVLVLALPWPQEDRYERWVSMRQRGLLNAIEAAAFAGEFRAEAEAQRFARRMGAFVGFSTAGAGGLFALLAASSDLPKTDRLIAASIGGGMLLGGLVAGIVTLVVETPIEEDWEEYRRGMTPVD